MCKRQPPILVSACLLGVRCRYDGQSKPAAGVIELLKHGSVLPVCPEQLGGLPTPRIPHERVGDRVLSRDGDDATEAFVRGAKEALRLAELAGCSEAILKARSPSCGVGTIYDGTFRGTITVGDGVFGAMVKRAGLRVRTEEDDW